MDGVLVDSERLWAAEETPFLAEAFGHEIAQAIGSMLGRNIDDVHADAVSHGAMISLDAFHKLYDVRGASIYSRAAYAEGVCELVDFLRTNGFRIGLVSATRYTGIDSVMQHLSCSGSFDVILSTNDDHLTAKPSPRAYLEALKRLRAEPDRSIVLEDSARGIESAHAAGAYVIGFTEFSNTPTPHGADAYASTMTEVRHIVETRIALR